jgi:hypothetical protein
VPTVSLDPDTYRILKKISKMLKVSMSSIVRIALIKQIKHMVDEGIPPELELEMYYYELTELYRLLQMSIRIKRWFNERLEELKALGESEDYTPIKVLANNYVERIKEIYEELEKSFKEKKKITKEEVEEKIGEEIREEIEIIEEEDMK